MPGAGALAHSKAAVTTGVLTVQEATGPLGTIGEAYELKRGEIH